MGGSVPFEVALKSRLDLIQPSSAQCATVSNQLRLTPGSSSLRFTLSLFHHLKYFYLIALFAAVEKLIQLLHAQNKLVCLVSGGFRQMIAPVAATLQIAPDCIFANELLFNVDGSYCGFDESCFTARSGGKARAVEYIKQTFGLQRVVMIGDGVTDLEARVHAVRIESSSFD
jgi:phosphoserine phosphatase